MSDSSPVPAFQALLLQSETGILRRDSDVDNLDILNNHTSPSGSSVLSSSINTETGLNAKEVSSGASTVTSICTTTSSSGTSHNVADEGKEQIVAPKTQGYKAGTSIVLQMNAPPHPVDEFLLQLTKMLTDDNKDYIEWRNASVFVTDPPGLEKFILPRYFRHSNYSTFVSRKCAPPHHQSYFFIAHDASHSWHNVICLIRFQLPTATPNELLWLSKNCFWQGQDVTLLLCQWKCERRHIKLALDQTQEDRSQR